MAGKPLIGCGFARQNGPCPILRVEFDNRTPTDETRFEPFSSSFRPHWRESRAQLTKKQVVLLMHDIYIKYLNYSDSLSVHQTQLNNSQHH